MLPRLDQFQLFFDLNIELQIFINLENLDCFACYRPNGALSLFVNEKLIKIYKTMFPFQLHYNFGFSKDGTYFYFFQKETQIMHLYLFEQSTEIEIQCQYSFYKILLNKFFIAQEEKQNLIFMSIENGQSQKFEKQWDDQFEIEDLTKTNKYIVTQNKYDILFLQYHNQRIITLSIISSSQISFAGRVKIIQSSEANLFYYSNYNAPIRQYSIRTKNCRLIRKFIITAERMAFSSRSSNQLLIFHQQAIKKQPLLNSINLQDGTSNVFRVLDYNVEDQEDSEFVLVDREQKFQKESLMEKTRQLILNKSE